MSFMDAIDREAEHIIMRMLVQSLISNFWAYIFLAIMFKITERQHIIILVVLLTVLLYFFLKTIYTYSFFNEKENRVIIAFGDSLTEGLHSWPKSKRFHPYTLKLQELIDNHIRGSSSKLDITVKNYGQSGERLTKTMKNRLRKVLRNNDADLAILLAGTNDLVDWHNGKKSRSELQRILNDLQMLHLICYYNGKKTVALTIPETKFDEVNTNGSLPQARRWLNAELKRFVHNRKLNSVVVDISTKITRRNNTELWDDGLHLTPKGYNRVAELVYQGIREHIAGWISNYDKFFDK